MGMLSESPANLEKLGQFRQVLAEALDEALQRGFFGSVTVEVSVQDGTIQHIRLRVERIQK